MRFTNPGKKKQFNTVVRVLKSATADEPADTATGLDNGNWRSLTATESTKYAKIVTGI